MRSLLKKRVMAQSSREQAALTILPLNTQAPHYKWLVAAIILLASATQIFAGTSLNIVIPRLMLSFGTDLATTQWVATGFLLSRTLVIPLLGWLGSVCGNRTLFVGILIGFVLSSIGCGLATSLPMLIAFRVLQGAVMGPLEGLTAVILVQAFPVHQRGLAIGLRTVGWATGELLFYTVGGYLFEYISWRMLFFLGIPFGIASTILGFLILPQHPETRSPQVDYPGLLLLGSFLVPLLLAISLARDNETATSTLLGLALFTLAGGGLFVLRELWAAFPAVNVRLFRQGAFCLLCSTAFFNNMGLFGALFMVPIFLQQVLGLTPLQAGLLLLPALPISGISGLLGGRLCDKIAPPFVAIGGLLALTVIFWAFSAVTAMTTGLVLVGYMILYRAFMDTIGIPVTALTVQTLAPEHIRMGQGLLGVVRSIGASFGVTVTSVFFERRRALHQFSGYSDYDSASLTHAGAVHEANWLLADAGLFGAAAEQIAFGALRQQMDNAAIVVSFQESFLLVCLCFFLAMIPMLCLLYKRVGMASGHA